MDLRSAKPGFTISVKIRKDEKPVVVKKERSLDEEEVEGERSCLWSLSFFKLTSSFSAQFWKQTLSSMSGLVYSYGLSQSLSSLAG